MFGSFLPLIPSVINAAPPPDPGLATEGCRRCQRRKEKEAQGGLLGFSAAITGVVGRAAAEVSTLLPHVADLDRYSKDHIRPDPIARQVVPLPAIAEEIQTGDAPLAKQFVNFDYEKYPIDASEQIRVLELLSTKDIEDAGHGNISEMVCCRLRTAKPGEDPYDALSYTWGPPGNFPIVILPGIETKSQQLMKITATPQLYAAFSCLRKSGTKHLWVDQICINQANDSEKMKQIGRMDKIYQNAKETVVWLGLADESTGRIKGLLDSFETECSSREGEAVWVTRAFGFDGARIGEQKDNYDALLKLLNREWFSRAWIFQEAVLSNSVTIQCEEFKLEYNTVVRLSEAVYTAENKTAGYARSLMKTTVGYNTLDLIKHAKEKCDEEGCQLVAKFKPGNLFETLVLALQHLRATVPNDLINAFIGVVYREPSRDEMSSPTTSTKMIPLGQEFAPGVAWMKAAWHIIDTTQSLDILSAASGLSEKPYDIPSWVPDWSQCFKFASPITPPDFPTAFMASNGVLRSFSTSDGGRTLHVRGAIVDCIVYFSSHEVKKYYFMEPHSNRTGLILKVHEQAEELQRELKGKPISSKDPRDELRHVVIRTMLADGAFGGMGIKEDDHDLLDVYDLEEDIKKLDASDSPDRAILRNIETWGLIAQQKAPFLTRERMLGLAGHGEAVGAQVGDQIAIIAGSKVPIVLRRVGKEDGNKFSVICQCYIDGMMYGEQLSRLEMGELQLI